jgi:ABC-type Fe3+/spermidine/putrescine transport system ATPase subunit
VARALHAAHATAIMVTHDQNEALSLADQVAVMRGGRLAQVAAPDVVYTKPADPDTATFVGAAALPTARIDGGVAHCALGPLPVPPGSAQGAARLLIRPEHLQLRTHPAPGGVPARVTDVTYFGHDASVHLVLEPAAHTSPPASWAPARQSRTHWCTSSYVAPSRSTRRPRTHGSSAVRSQAEVAALREAASR